MVVVLRLREPVVLCVKLNSTSPSQAPGAPGVNHGAPLMCALPVFPSALRTNFSGALAGQGAELTGTGDGRLFGFFTTQPFATLAQIDKASGATMANQSLNGVNTGFDWAVSFWGGDFWFYTSPGGIPSTVTRKQTSTDGSIATAKQDVGGFRIVGAGVSTCAPTTPPAPR